MASAGSPEHMGQRAAQLERGLGSDRLDVGDAAHAVGAEEFTMLFSSDVLARFWR